jgi:hypothetical protein
MTDAAQLVETLEAFAPVYGVVLLVWFLFFTGILPIPVGYERGKVKFLMWCGTGMHAHIVFWHGEVEREGRAGGFQAIHPEELSDD